KWRTEILDEIRARHARGEPLSVSEVRRAGGANLKLFKRAKRVFNGGWVEAVDAALGRLGKKYEDVGFYRRTVWTREKIADEITALAKSGVNLSYRSMIGSSPERRRLYKAAYHEYGNWRKAVEAQAIDYGEHVRKWMEAHRKGGKPELTRDRLFDLIEERWRSGSALNPRHKALGGATSAAKRLFPPTAGSWKRAIEAASRERKLGIDYALHVLKNVPGKWSKEKIKEEILRWFEAGKPLHEGHAKKKHPDFWGVVNYHYREEGGWRAAVNAAGIDYEEAAAAGRRQALEARKSRMRDPHFFARALLDREAEVGAPLKSGHVYKTRLGKWVLFHGGIEKARQLMERAKAALGDNERLALAARAGSEAAVEQLLKVNEGYLRMNAAKYGRRLEPQDALQLAKLGFVNATKKFRAVKGAKLTTYAWQEIRRAIEREVGGLYAGGERIRVPVHAGAKAARLSAEEARILAERGGRLSQEAAERVVGRGEAAELARTARHVVSLAAPLHGEEKRTVEDVIAGEAGKAQAAGVEAEKVRAALDKLGETHPRHAEVLRRRFGIESGEEQTLAEIGRDFGVTREYARQLEAAAKEKLRKLLAEKQ
ncbi:MAG: sigma factor-like helix-turn-helix DNA-binding protein, partial [Candidatus Micrarchaeota archaeon]